MLTTEPTGSPATLVAAAVARDVVAPAITVYEAGGRTILNNTAQDAVRQSLGLLADEAISSTLTAEVVRAAGREVFKGIGKAAGVGSAIDAGVACIEVIPKVSSGEMSPSTASSVVAKEAASGAASSAAGVGAVALVVGLTGPISAPAALALSAGAALGTKLWLRFLF